MRIRHPLIIRVIAAFAAAVVRVWMSTIRVRIVSADGRQHPANPEQERFVYAFWHESLLAPLATRPKIRVLISQHRDGELIAQVCQWLGIGVVRGSSSRGGCQALLEMIRSDDQKSHLGITPDGPQGPRRQLQPGAVMVASCSGLRLVPLGIGFVKAWRARSWDRFAVPVPFSTLVGVLGEPMQLPADLDRQALKHWQAKVELRMAEVTQLAENWCERIAVDRAAEPPHVPTMPALRQSA